MVVGVLDFILLISGCSRLVRACESLLLDRRKCVDGMYM